MLKLFNTLSRKKEAFKPLHGKTVNMYVCGPTVYGPGHIGHARTYVAFDIIRRYLEYEGFQVNYVVNITDVHDDMIATANKEGITIFQLAERNIPIFFEDMEKMHIKKATANPRVTENIEGIIGMTSKLLEKGIGYETADGVYFSIKKFKGYGKLSKVKLKKEVTGTRVETDKYDKEHPSDFALWKKAKPTEPSWESPFGNGRPGWHIECSVMSTKHLGYPIDIHGGAVDLIFPHHENEIAQSEAYFSKKPFVKYWLHTGFLNVKGEKMAKSLGNFITIPEMLKKYDPKAFRYFIAEAHYRSRIDFNEKSMEKAKASLEKINRLVQSLQEIKAGIGSKAEKAEDVQSALEAGNEANAGNENKKSKAGNENKEVQKLIDSARKKFKAAMENDFNTPIAIAVVHEFVRKCNGMLNKGKLGKIDSEKILGFMGEIDSVFKFLTFEKESLELPTEILELVEKREAARKDKNWQLADEIRAQLREKGYQILDTKEGPKLEKAG